MKIIALAGGVGGAKMVDGLARILRPEELVIIVNTGDDFEHFGLSISPDIDTVCYTLAGMSNPETGWGVYGDTFQTLEKIHELGGPNWFRMGDIDLATHFERTRRLHEGQTLSQITQDFCQKWGVQPVVLPMSNQTVRTIVETIEYGELAFQEYFVRQNCEPTVKGFRFEGVEKAKPTPGILEHIKKADAIVICPSNPWVSIDPILALNDIRAAVIQKTVVAVSPIIGGKTIKGPAAKMFIELGFQPSSLSVAQHYEDILSGFILDSVDAGIVDGFTIPTFVTNTLMTNRLDRVHLAEDVLNFIRKIKSG